ncbi:Fur family transcriptional regulator [Actinomadura macra]|uniref:Fur family transcriptional regulator n=1 Tax=Actinomadura macra TaxID=46164 RepID=UPI00082E2FF4|nr:transcriptional repressor [Actinomadura macra]
MVTPPDACRVPPARRLAWATDRLRAAVRRSTRPRRLLLDVLAHADGHLTVETIHRHASAKGPLDLSTSYRTMTVFERLRLVHTVMIGGRTTYGLADHPHAHAVCDRCARVTALRGHEWHQVSMAARSRLKGFTCDGIIIRGACHDCADVLGDLPEVKDLLLECGEPRVNDGT